LLQVIDAGHVVVAAGGGGVPVVEHEDTIRGVEAVVDKDRSAARLATLVGADLLLVLTAVESVEVGYGTPGARPLEHITAAEARELLEAGEFPEGSMGPKVEACCEFVEATGMRAVIAALDHAREATFGGAGTTIGAT
jgi:carbamate kinase